MNCERVRGEIKAYLDGELGRVMRGQVERHLAGCEECRKELDEMAELTEQVRGVEQAGAPEGLRGRVLAGIEFEAKQKTGLRWPFKASPVMAALVLVAVAVAASVMSPVFFKHPQSKVDNNLMCDAPKISRVGAALDLYLSPEEKSVQPHSARVCSQKTVIPGSTQGLSKTIGASQPQMIIKTADMGVLVKDFDMANDSAIAIAKSAGGFVTDSSTENSGDSPTSGNMTLRVPVQSFESVMSRLGKLGKVEQKSIRGEDVSGEVVDLNSRLRNLRAQEKQYLDIMNRAKHVGDVVTVTNELYRVRGDIEEAEGRLKYLKNASAMSTINLSLYEKEKPKPVKGSSLMDTFGDALASLGRTANGLAATLIWLVVYSPFWAVPVGALLVWRKRNAAA